MNSIHYINIFDEVFAVARTLFKAGEPAEVVIPKTADAIEVSPALVKHIFATYVQKEN